MSSYFIYLPKETGWKLDHATFVESLRVHWPDADIRIADDPTINYPLEWTLQMPEMRLDGTLDREGKAINLDGDIRDCAQFALWVRSLIPNEYKLVFFDEEYTASVEIEKETTEEELVKPFLAE